jgi:hypothetical protein
MNWLADQLGVNCGEGWYEVTTNDVGNFRGRSMISKYGDICSILNAVYPNFDWKPWKFRTIKLRHFWDKEDNQR